MALGKDRRSWLGRNGLNTHDLHESTYPFGIDFVFHSSEEIRHLTPPFGRMQQMFFVHDPHKFQILTALLERLIIDVRSMKPQEIALLSDADLAMG